MEKKFYVTTPIYYPNDIPHIGHAYTTIAADILARWHKLLGEDVFFLTGTDEHGKKIEQTAIKHGKSPKAFVDELVPKFKEAWNKLNIKYDRFIRTTDKDHEDNVKKILEIVYEKGDIYLGEYEGYYCTSCEAYYLEKDLLDECCPIHKTKIERLREKTYFFKLSKYQNKLLELYKKNFQFIQPEFRKKEIINRVKEGLNDLSISRTSFKWGIEIPFDKTHITYVWFDALTNYYTATREKGKEKFWPADVHLVGKDILWFHSVIWPAMLISAGIKTPKTVFAHGWWTFDKEKISKSAGKVINVDELINIAGVDSARYFLFRETPFGDDGDFSEQALIDRHNNELANKLGNLVSRVSALAETHGIKKSSNKLAKKLNLKKIEKHFDNYELDKALNEIFAFIDICNEYIQNKKPWESNTKGKQEILYELSDSIKAIAILLSPFIPETSEKISQVFNFKISYKNIKTPLKVSKIKKSPILFQKIEVKKQGNVKNENVNNTPTANKISSFYIEPKLKEMGIKAVAAIFENVNIANKNNQLEKLKKEVIERINSKKLNKQILDGYKEFYNNREFIPAAESVINIIKKNGRFPNINTVVDAYNIVSIESLLSIGAHNLSKIRGEIAFKITSGNEKFTPLGENKNIKIEAEEYAFMDDEKILCRFDVKQCDETKITKNTKSFIIYVQGNKETSEEYLENNLVKVCNLIKQICGGDYKIIKEKVNKEINTKSNNKIEGVIQMSQIEFKEWEKIELRVGQITKVEDIKDADKLYKLTISLGKSLGHRTVCAGLKKFYSKEELEGKKIIIFVNLAPRMMKGIESQGMLLAAVNEDESKVILISPEKDIEVGSKIR